jgi:hypothetical protein
MKTAAAGKSGASALGRLRWKALVVGDASRLAGTRDSSMQAGLHLFVVRVEPLDPLTLGATEAPFLTPCHSADR